MGINQLSLGKKKKISFRYYLHSREAIVDGVFYPLYVQVTFNRENTKLTSVIDPEGEVHYWRKEDLKKFINQDHTGSYRGEVHELLENEGLIERIIRHEFSAQGEKYSLKGLGDRLRIYKSRIIDTIEEHLFESYLLEAKYVDLSINLSRSEEFAKNFYLSIDKLSKSGFPTQTTLRQIELFVAVSIFSDPYFAGHYGVEEAQKTYSWVIDGAKEKFRHFVEKVAEKDPYLHFQSIKNEGRFIYYGRLVNEHLPKVEHIDYYLFLIDNQLVKVLNQL